MKRRLALLVPLALAACQDVPSPLGSSSTSSPAGLHPLFSRSVAEEYVAGEVIVQLRGGTDYDALAAKHGTRVAKKGIGNRFGVMVAAKGNERALAAELSADPAVDFAEPNYLRQPSTVDPRLWGFYNPGGLTMSFYNDPNGRTGVVTSKISSVDADEDNVSGYAAGGKAVVVGSIDTGVDFTHAEFLPGQLIAGKDWITGGANPTDTEGHGTHTTGTMVGQTVGIAGVSGAGANVRVLVQRVCDASGCPTSAIVNAIYAAADYPGLVAMNLSLGGSTESTAEKKAINYAVNTKHVLVIASAGNDGSTRISCPACDANAIAVAALNWQDQPAYYSNSGRGLDISAPGGEIYSNTTEEGGIYSSIPGGYAYYQGTSMAAPQVTGTAGIVASVTGLTGSALRNRILSTADDLGKAGVDNTFGYGRLNSYRAVKGTTLPSPQ